MKNKREIAPYSERYKEISKHIKEDHIALLDVGCRDGILQKYLNDSIKYYGIDIEPKADLLQGISPI